MSKTSIQHAPRGRRKHFCHLLTCKYARSYECLVHGKYNWANFARHTSVTVQLANTIELFQTLLTFPLCNRSTLTALNAVTEFMSNSKLTAYTNLFDNYWHKMVGHRHTSCGTRHCVSLRFLNRRQTADNLCFSTHRLDEPPIRQWHYACLLTGDATHDSTRSRGFTERSRNRSEMINKYRNAWLVNSTLSNAADAC